MAHQQVFISYSREQFYFVESLALSLQSYGVTVWFDVQRIYPGSDWERSIDEGLTTSTELILVVSQTALASSHVKKEWKHAYATNTPIYVVLFEDISLPSELKPAAIIDMRDSFEYNASLLAKLLLTKQRYYFERNTAAVPFLLSSGLLPVVASMWISVLLSLVGLTLISTILIIKLCSILAARPLLTLFSTLAIVVNWLFFVGHTVVYPWQFTRRDNFNMRMYLFSVYAMAIDTAALLAFDLEIFHRVLPHDLAEMLRIQYFSIENNFSLPLIGCGLMINMLATWLLRTRSALHWLRTGSAPDELRSQVNKKWLLQWQASPIPTAVKTYRLYYHPDDRYLADEVRMALGKNPYLQQGTEHQVDYHVAILSSKVSLASFNRLLDTTQHLVCVICTSIRLPEDKRPYLRLQWIDYRKRRLEQLTSLTNLLHHGTIYARGYAFSVLPENLEHKVLPQDLSLLSILLRGVAALSISISFFLPFFTGNMAFQLCIALATLLCGAYFFRSADKVEVYDISHNSLKVNYVLILLCVLLFDILAVVWEPNIPYSALLSLLQSSITVQIIAEMVIFIIFIILFVNQQVFLSKRVVSFVLVFLMIALIVNMCSSFTILHPDLNTHPWIYDIQPSIVIACFFTVVLVGLPFSASFSLTRIASLLPAQTPQRMEQGTEPTLAIPTHPCLTRTIYLLLALEVALLFLIQLYSQTGR